MVPRKWASVFLLSVSVASLQAQAVDVKGLDSKKAYELASAWIADHVPRDEAWAAELIAQYRFRDLSGELLAALRELTRQRSQEFQASAEELATEAVADAIITLDIPVSSVDARSLYPEFPALAMILLSRASDDNQADLFAILQETKIGEVWLASANLLAKNPTPEFVETLVHDFRIFTRILVFGPDTSGGMSYGDCYSAAKRPSPMSVTGDWPTFSRYGLQLARKGGTVFADGKNAVSYFTLADHEVRPWTGLAGCGGLDVQDLRRDLLVQLSGVDDSHADLRSVVLRDVRCRGDEECRDGIVDVLREQVASYKFVIHLLRSKQLVSELVLQQALKMDVWVVPMGAKLRKIELPGLRDLGIAGSYHFGGQ